MHDEHESRMDEQTVMPPERATAPTSETDQPRVHELKILPVYFAPALDGRKMFEVRYDDRDYCVGDVLVLNEWHDTLGYTGRSVRRLVTYLTHYGQSSGWVVLGLIDASCGNWKPSEVADGLHFSALFGACKNDAETK